MKSDGKIEIFGGVKGQTNLMIIKEAPKNRVLEYCDNIVLINCDLELSKLNELPLYEGTTFGNLVTAGV